MPRKDAEKTPLMSKRQNPEYRSLRDDGAGAGKTAEVATVTSSTINLVSVVAVTL